MPLSDREIYLIVFMLSSVIINLLQLVYIMDLNKVIRRLRRVN